MAGEKVHLTGEKETLLMTLYGKALGYDVVNAVTGVAYVASVPLIVVAPVDGPRTLPDLIALLKKEPGKHSYASSGNGGIIHLAGFLLLEKAGVDALHVPYRGSAPGMIDTIAGRHAFQVDTLGSSKGFLDSGKLRVLAVMADKRLPQLPDVPTVEETSDSDSPSAVPSTTIASSDVRSIATSGVPTNASTLPAPASAKRVTPPSPAIQSTLSRQRTRPVTCSTSCRRIVSVSPVGRAVTLATRGARGVEMLAPASATAISSAAGCMSGQWKGAETFSGMARAPSSLAFSIALSTAALAPEITTLP